MGPCASHPTGERPSLSLSLFVLGLSLRTTFAARFIGPGDAPARAVASAQAPAPAQPSLAPRTIGGASALAPRGAAAATCGAARFRAPLQSERALPSGAGAGWDAIQD